MLQALGISKDAETVYVALVLRDSAEIADLRTATEIHPDTVRASLMELRELGLAVEVTPGRWKALPLPDVLQTLRERRESEILAASVAAESLYSNLLAAEQSSDSDQITVLVGREACVAAHTEFLDGVKKELCLFDKPPYVNVREAVTPEDFHETSAEWRAIERGVTTRSVYHPGFDQDRLAELALFAERGEQSRTGPVPMKLVLGDRQTAFMPSMRSFTPGHDVRVSVVRHPLLVEALQWLFEAVWDQSVPVVASFLNDGDPRRQMLVSLLMTGSTDSAIATQLGINVRSVRRWISELMDELGVTTRLQLGAALVRSENFRGTTSRPKQSSR